MSDPKAYLRGQGRIWVQVEGVATPWQYFGCYGMGDIAIPRGDKTLIYCPSKSKADQFDVVNSYRGEAGPVTTSLDSLLFEAKNWLLSLNCEFNLAVRYGVCERPDNPVGWEKIIHLESADITNRGISQPAVRVPGDQAEVTTSADISANKFAEISRIKTTQQGTDLHGAYVNNLLDVTYCNSPSCGGDCGAYSEGCKVGWAVGEGGMLAYTPDGGDQWYVMTPPTGWATDDINAVCCTGDFVLLTNGTQNEIAWSDDNGATWNVVTTGFAYATTMSDCFMWGSNAMWVVSDGGYVFFSEDGGMTWEVQDAGVATSEDLNEIHFLDSDLGYAVGAANAVIKTENGGKTWTTLVGPAAATVLNCVWTLTEQIVYVGAADGALYVSYDGGATWATAFSLTAANVTGISFGDLNDYGFLTVEDTSGLGRVYRTIDGGYTWERVTIATNTGLDAVFACDENNFTAVGDGFYITRGEATA